MAQRLARPKNEEFRFCERRSLFRVFAVDVFTYLPGRSIVWLGEATANPGDNEPGSVEKTNSHEPDCKKHGQ